MIPCNSSPTFREMLSEAQLTYGVGRLLLDPDLPKDNFDPITCREIVRQLLENLLVSLIENLAIFSDAPRVRIINDLIKSTERGITALKDNTDNADAYHCLDLPWQYTRLKICSETGTS